MSAARPGVVYLVGAGPGDPGLITARALELIAAADAILHDRLIPTTALAGARADAELIDVGKAPGEAASRQAEIEHELVRLARAGRSVVRLKGGDPFVFGRGGEEAEALRAAGVEFEVVPGISAGIAAPAYAGIPVTGRGDASAVAFVAGHEDPGKQDSALDWNALAAFPGTLVVYMGVANLAAICARLLAAGRAAEEPAAAVERGTAPDQRTIEATTATLADAAAAAELRAPAIVLFGPVAARRERIAWFERRPLHGKRIVVTRARAGAGELAAALRGLGAAAVELPAIRVEARTGAPEVEAMVEDLHTYALVCLTSPTGVELLFAAMAERGLDARALANATVAAIGPGTARALRAHGVIADIVPPRSVAESLVESLREVEVEGRPVLIARAAAARDVLPAALIERGARVDVVALYETVREQPTEDALERARDADYVTFTSASSAQGFAAAVGAAWPQRARLVAIGPATAAALRELGHAPDVEATRHDPGGLIEALLADAADGRE